MAGQLPDGPQQKCTLEELFSQHKGKVTDKWCHYLGQYERILKAYRSNPIFLLEIGVQNGGSLEIWGQYFQAARKIVGVDIDPKCSCLAYDDPRIAVVVGDANSKRTQEAILVHASEFDVIIDDGSHQSGDIVKAFARYFPVLSAGGVYVVEDLHCSYWEEHGGGLYHPFSAVTFFKRLADIVNHEHWGIGAPPAEILKGFFSRYGFELDQVALESVRSVEFTNSLCVIRKQGTEHIGPLARVVAGSEALVAPGIIELDGTPRSIPDQTSNVWTARSMPPEEELPIRLEELGERAAQIASLSEELAQHRADMTKLDDHIAELNQALSQRDEELANYQDQIAKLKDYIAELNEHITELNQAISKRDEHISAVHQTITERDRYMKVLDQELTDQRTEAAELKSQLQQLESSLASASAKLKDRDNRLRKRDQELKEARRQNARLRAELRSLYSSRSWRITGPLRALSRMLHVRWFIRNSRRALRLLGWLAAGQFGRAARALLPYYGRFVPTTVKKLLPNVLRKTIKRWLLVDVVRQHSTHKSITTRATSQDMCTTPIMRTHCSTLRRQPRIMYLSGAPGTPPEVYRVQNYVEALRLVGVDAGYIKRDDFDHDRSRNALIEADVLVLAKYGHTAELEDLIRQRRERARRTVFEADDLIIRPDLADARYIDAIRFRGLNPDAVKAWYEGYKRTLLLCDFGFASTEPLAEEMRKLGKEAFVLPNGLGRGTLVNATAALVSRGMQEQMARVRIGYASGTPTHQRDFAVVAPVIAKLLAARPEVTFTTFAACLELDEFPELRPVMDQVEFRSLVELDQLPYEIARFDINIAPLEQGNPFCEAKSELKYFEAAILGIPTVASPTEPFRKAITPGVTGFLAGTQEQWFRCLTKLVDNPDMRKQIGLNAMSHALAAYGPESLGRLARQIVGSIIAQPLSGGESKRDLRTPNPIRIGPYEVIYRHQQGVPPGDVAVVVPLYEQERLLWECLDSVASQTIRASTDLIIVDDASKYQSLNVALDWAEARGSHLNAVYILSHREKQGIGVALNTGIQYSDCSYYFPLAPSHLLSPNCLESCLRVMHAHEADRHIVGVHPTRSPFDTVTGDPDGQGQPSFGLDLGGREVDRLAGGNQIGLTALLRRSAWRRVGGHADSHGRGGRQGYGFWRKLDNAGLECIWSKDAAAYFRAHSASSVRKSEGTSRHEEEAGQSAR